jgi:diguanylate cyclase (GGDEF)-like protein
VSGGAHARSTAASIFFALVTLASAASAQVDVVRLGERDTYDLASHVRVFAADPESTIEDFDALEARGRFEAPEDDPVRALQQGGELWILVDVARTTEGRDEWVLWDRGAAQFLDVRVDTGERTVVHRSGYFVAPQDRPLQAFGYAFPFELGRGATARIALRGYLPPRDSTELVVVSGERFRYLNIATSVLVFGVMGAMLALALYNLFLFAFVRDHAYGYYAFYALSSAFFWAMIHSVLTLFTRDGRGDLTLQGFSVLLTGFAALRFTQVFLELRRTAPRLDRWFWALYAVLAVMTALLLVLPQHEFKIVSLVLGVPLVSTLLLTPLHALARGHRRARLMVVGWAPLMALALVIALRGLGALEAAWLSKDVLLAFHGFEVLSMALAVGDRIREIDAERERAQKEGLAQMTLRLEEREQLVRAVHATRSAEQQAERERVRASTDELTGLRNRRAFDSERLDLAAEWAPGGVDLMVIVIDIDGLKSLNDRTGHAEGDRLLAEFGQHLRAALRETDRTYRVGGDEFAVLARAPDAVACTAIERRIAGAITKLKAGFAGVDASVGSALLSEVEGSVLEAYRRADERMYAQKRKHHEERQQGDGDA